MADQTTDSTSPAPLVSTSSPVIYLSLICSLIDLILSNQWTHGCLRLRICWIYGLGLTVVRHFGPCVLSATPLMLFSNFYFSTLTLFFRFFQLFVIETVDFNIKCYLQIRVTISYSASHWLINLQSFFLLLLCGSCQSLCISSEFFVVCFVWSIFFLAVVVNSIILWLTVREFLDRFVVLFCLQLINEQSYLPMDTYDFGYGFS